MQKFAQERDKTESELKHKLLSEVEKDLVHSVEKYQLLHENCQLLQEMNNEKKMVIRRLEKELNMKECHLQSVQQEAQAMKNEVSKLQAQLEEKHKEVNTLREELIKPYNYKKDEAKVFRMPLPDQDEMEV